MGVMLFFTVKAGNEERDEFLEEICMLKRVGQHPNVVSLLACVTLQEDLCMVMEYIPCGDLRKYLHDLRHKFENRKPSVTSLVQLVYMDLVVLFNWSSLEQLMGALSGLNSENLLKKTFSF